MKRVSAESECYRTPGPYFVLADVLTGIPGLEVVGPFLLGCCGLNENGSCRFMYLNAWSTVSETVWEGL